MFLQDYVDENNLRYDAIYKFIQRNKNKLFGATVKKKDNKIWITPKGIDILNSYYAGRYSHEAQSWIDDLKRTSENQKKQHKKDLVAIKNLKDAISEIEQKFSDLKTDYSNLKQNYNEFKFSNSSIIQKLEDELKKKNRKIEELEEELKRVYDRPIFERIRNKKYDKN